ncbi:Zinc carboxypeptidase family protein [Brugia pahangi]
MIIFSSILLILVAAEKSAFVASGNERNYTILRITPLNIEQIQFLSALYLNDDKMADFWKPPTRINETIHIMINPGFMKKFDQLLNEKSISYHIEINDFAQYLKNKKEMKEQRNLLFDNNRERRFWDDNNRNSNIFLGKYNSYDSIVRWLKNLEQRYDNIVTVKSIGKTAEERIIYGVKLGTKNVTSKPVIWLDAGIHAREWVAIHTALYLIQQLIIDYNSNSKIGEYLRLLDIYIYPCLNPDGYEYTQTKPNDPSVRLWRKSRGSTTNYEWENGEKRYCKGVDLNRNFAFHFGEIGSSSSPCSNIYRGKYAFSEPETQAVRDALLPLREQIKAYITLHTYSQLWIYPYSHAANTYSSDIDELKAVAKEGVNSLMKLYGTEYQYGTGPEVIYAFSGGSSDWAKQSANVKYSYTIELRPSKSSNAGFILDKRELIPIGRETYEGIKVVIDKVIMEYKQSRNL